MDLFLFDIVSFSLTCDAKYFRDMLLSKDMTDVYASEALRKVEFQHVLVRSN